MEMFLLKFTKELRDRHWQVVFVFAGQPADWFAAILTEMDVNWLIARFPLNHRTFWTLRRALRPYRPDTIQTMFISPFSVWLWLLKSSVGAKHLIINDHTSGTVRPKTGFFQLLARWRGWLAGLVIDKVITVSNFIAQRDIQEIYLPAYKVQRIYNGVDTDRYHPRHRTPGQSDAVHISYAGQLIPEKGVLTLLKAYRELVAGTSRPIELRIAGVGPQADELKEFCFRHQLTQVQFLGQIDSVPELYASSDIVVIPSEWDEAFGFVVAEAMACGTAVICSDAGGIPEVLGDPGEAGLIFCKGNIQELKEKLAYLVNEPEVRAALGARGRERAVQLFSLKSMVRQYVSVYQQIE
jgi:glycosyltransferase involved in cell wall biosynthesis